MNNRRTLSKLIVAVLTIASLLFNVVQAEMDDGSFVLDNGTIDTIKKLMDIKNDVFSKEKINEITKSIVKVEACDD